MVFEKTVECKDKTHITTFFDELNDLNEYKEELCLDLIIFLFHLQEKILLKLINLIYTTL